VNQGCLPFARVARQASLVSSLGMEMNMQLSAAFKM